MKSGFGTEGTKYLRFCAVDCRVGRNVELFGVIKALENGIKISVLSERHRLKSSRMEADEADDITRKRKSERLGSSFMLLGLFKLWGCV